MNIIVTTNKVEYEGFLNVKSLRDASQVVGSIDFLVYHKSNEKQESIIDYLSELKDKAKTLVYIRNKDKADQAIQMIVTGSGGKYIDDEFFLENSNELNNLLSQINSITALVEMGGVNVLSDFFNRYLQNGSSGFNKQYLAVVREAVSGMITEYKQKELEIIQMSETATEIFARSSKIISGIEEERKNLQDAIKKMKDASESKSSYGAGLSGIPNVLFFPQISYPKDKHIIRIKDIGGCIFLTSFAMGLRLYLEQVKNVRPKLIFVESVGSQYETKYKGYPWITQRTYKSMENFFNPVVFVNYPIKDVLFRLLDDTDYDTFIIVDKLRASKNHVLNSRGNTVKYAISGEGIINKFNLKKPDCFCTIREVKGTMFTVPVFPEYPIEKEQRIRLYMRSCDSFYEVLSSKK